MVCSRRFIGIALLLITLVFLTLGCAQKVETAKDTIPNNEVRDTALTAGWFTIPDDVIYWMETEVIFDPTDPNRVIEKRFYTNDLARAQNRVPFPIVLPTYIPYKAERIAGPSIEGPLISESDNRTDIIVRYDVYLGEAWSQIFITEANYDYSLGDPELNPQLDLVDIGGKQVVTEEGGHPLGPAKYFSFNSDNIYFVVESYNLPADEATKVVESIIRPTEGFVPTTETEIVPETPEPTVIPETGKASALETEIILEPNIFADTHSLENALSETIAVIQDRLSALGISGARVNKQDADLIVVQLPKVENVDHIIALVTSRGELSFRELVADNNGLPILDDKGEQQWTIAKAIGSDGQETELTGKFLKPNAQVVRNPQYNQPEVTFDWNDEGAILFKQITERNLGKPLGIFLDDKLLSAPTVQSVIKDKGVITGLTLEDARALAIQLNSGALLVPLRVVSIKPNGKIDESETDESQR
jgi:hypothetical protein